jgi:uncharacterized beta-barrel protein YwiB (DUF1934 family)
MAANKQVKINIVSTQYEGDGNGEKHIVSFSCEGVMSKKASRIEVKYEEDLSGGGRPTVTSVSFDALSPELVSLARRGEVNSSCAFSKGERYMCNYDAGFVKFDFCVATKSVVNSLTYEKGGTLCLDYGMEVRGVSAQQNEYRLTVGL